MRQKSKRIPSVFFIYWILLSYITAALIFWFVALNRQNKEIIALKKIHQPALVARFQKDYENKQKQYWGEGATFFLVIIAGAGFFYKAIRRQLRIVDEQQHFMMAVTHELKTPIAVAKLNLETLQKRKLDEAQQQRLVHIALQETTRLDVLCNNMLISSQIEAGGYRMMKQELNVSKMVEQCAEGFRERFPGRKVVTEIEKDILLTADNTLLEIAVNNLLENALKYAPKQEPIKLSLSLNDNVAEIKVWDRGPGIAEEEKKKVFEKYYRLGNEATRRAKGTGLGLYITRKIIKNHGGNVFVEDNPGAGSIFTIQLAVIE